MNDSKLKHLFEQARKDAPPVPPPDFTFGTLARLHPKDGPESPTLFDQLNALFPRLAFAAVVVIALCIAGELWLSSASETDLSTGVAQVSENWSFAGDGF